MHLRRAKRILRRISAKLNQYDRIHCFKSYTRANYRLIKRPNCLSITRITSFAEINQRKKIVCLFVLLSFRWFLWRGDKPKFFINGKPHVGYSVIISILLNNRPNNSFTLMSILFIMYKSYIWADFFSSLKTAPLYALHIYCIGTHIFFIVLRFCISPINSSAYV